MLGDGLSTKNDIGKRVFLDFNQPIVHFYCTSILSLPSVTLILVRNKSCSLLPLKTCSCYVLILLSLIFAQFDVSLFSRTSFFMIDFVGFTASIKRHYENRITPNWRHLTDGTFLCGCML